MIARDPPTDIVSEPLPDPAPGTEDLARQIEQTRKAGRTRHLAIGSFEARRHYRKLTARDDDHAAGVFAISVALFAGWWWFASYLLPSGYEVISLVFLLPTIPAISWLLVGRPATREAKKADDAWLEALIDDVNYNPGGTWIRRDCGHFAIYEPGRSLPCLACAPIDIHPPGDY